VDVILEIKALLDVIREPARRGEAQHGHGHGRGSLNGGSEQRPVGGNGEEPDDGDGRDLQGDLERLHGLQRSAAARALDDVRPVPVR
jgi:hypothetical protein